MRLAGLTMALAMLTGMMSVASSAQAQSGDASLRRIAAFLADAPLSASEQSSLDRAWTSFRAERSDWRAHAQGLNSVARRLDEPTTSYQRVLMRDKLAALAYCPVPATDPEKPLQQAMAAAVRAHAPMVASDCANGALYVVTRADVAALLAEHRFFAQQTGLQVPAWDDGRSVDAWAADLLRVFPTATVLGKERLAHAESRWVLTQFVWREANAEQRRSILAIVREGAGAQGNLAEGVLHLHKVLILGGTSANLNAQARAFMEASRKVMGAQAMSDAAMRELRTWGN